MALARSMEIRSGTVPYMPNSTTEAARNRCAKPHQATALDRGVLHPGKQQQQAEDRLDIDRHHEQRIDVEIHHAVPARFTPPGPHFCCVPVLRVKARQETSGEWRPIPARNAPLWFRGRCQSRRRTVLRNTAANRPRGISSHLVGAKLATRLKTPLKQPESDMQIRDGIIEAIGHTPLIKLERASQADRLHHSGQGRIHESGRLGEGPRRPADDPGGGSARRTAPRRAGGGGDRRQYRHRPRAGRQCARLSHAHRHAATRRARKRRTCCGCSAPNWSRCRRCPTAIRTITSMSAAGWPSNSRRREKNGVIFADQWNNLDNRKAHYVSTGPEIWQQTGGKIDGFICVGRHRRHARRRLDAICAR